MFSDITTQLQAISLWGNTGYQYVLAFGIFIGLLIVLKLFQVAIIARLKGLAQKTKTDFDDVLIEIFSNIKPPFYLLVALYFGINVLSLHEIATMVIKVLFLLVVVYELIQAADRLVSYAIRTYLQKTRGDEHELEGDQEAEYQQMESMLKVLRIVIKIGLWAVGLLLILSNLGVNITSLVASLGIGGLAIALALQTVLSDLISSFSIYMDKPFKVGDFIIVGDDMGVVEKIGFKTTRIRDLQGQQLVISNQELTSTRIHNFKRMQRRRIPVTLGVVYETPHEKLEKIPTLIKDIITKETETEFDRCHFKSYGDFSLNYEYVYFVDTADYNEYMDIQQRINLAINKAFVDEGIEFAYPTQTIIVQK